MDKLDFLLEKLQLLEQRMKVMEGTLLTDRSATILTMREMSTTISMMMAKLLPIVAERSARQEMILDQVTDFIVKQQKYVM